MIVECPACQSRYDVGARSPGTRARCRCGNVFQVARPTESAGTLKCPQCGAAADPNAATCAYCHAALAVVACPRCFGRVFQGNTHCPHCGAPVDLPAADASKATPRACPRCAPADSRLVARVVDGTLLDECARCGGVWLDAAAFDSVVKDRERQAALLDQGGARSRLEVQGTGSNLDAEVRYLKCPDCHQMMNRQNFGKRSGVIVDVCKVHGVWFDKDELGRIIQFVMAGGLLETRRRELEEMQRQIEAKRSELNAASMGSSNPMEHWPRAGLLGALFDFFDLD